MKEYIEREAAINEFDYQSQFYDAEWGNKRFAPDDVETIIRSIPAADVVPVVRCGECVFHEVADYGEGYTKNVCRLLNRQIQNDDFCSYGAKMDKDGDT